MAKKIRNVFISHLNSIPIYYYYLYKQSVYFAIIIKDFFFFADLVFLGDGGALKLFYVPTKSPQASS